MIISKVNYTSKGFLEFISTDGKNVTDEITLHFNNGELVNSFQQSFVEIPKNLWGYRKVYITDNSGEIVFFSKELLTQYFTNRTEEKIQIILFNADFMYIGTYSANKEIKRKLNNFGNLFFEHGNLGVKVSFETKMPYYFKIKTSNEAFLVNFRKKENNIFLLDLTSIDIDDIESIHFVDYQFKKQYDYFIYSRKQQEKKMAGKLLCKNDKIGFSETGNFINLDNESLVGQLGTNHFELDNHFQLNDSYIQKYKNQDDQPLEIFSIQNGVIVHVCYNIPPKLKENKQYYVFKNTIIFVGFRKFTGDIKKEAKSVHGLSVNVANVSDKSFDLIFANNIITLQLIKSSNKLEGPFSELVNSIRGNVVTVALDGKFNDLGIKNGVKNINLFANVSFYGEASPKLYKLQLMNDTSSEKNNQLFFKNKVSLIGGVGKYHQYVQIFENKNNDITLLKGPLHNLVKSTFGWGANVEFLKRQEKGYKLTLKITGLSQDIHSIQCVRLINRNVLDPKENDYEVTIIEENPKEIIIESIIDLSHLYVPFYWDLFVILQDKNSSFPIQVDKLSDDVKKLIDVDVFEKELAVSQDTILYPYVTAGGSLAFTFRKIESYENAVNFKKENRAYTLYNFFRKYFDKKNIWIVFEKNSFGAHDNAFHFFKYMYENEKHPNTYYVIRRDSPEYKNLKNMQDRVLDFMSLKYFIYMFAAKVFISSDTKFHAYNLQRRDSLLAKSMLQKKNVFLQHGMNGIKKVPVFHKKRGLLDLVIAPSNFERENINIKQWGYSPEEVIATGYARWDSYIDKSSEIAYRQIFMMPTWRKSMEGMSREQFLGTTFYKEYQTFLKSPKLKEVLIRNNVRLAFFLHPYFKNYVDLFDIDESFTDKHDYLDVDMGEEIMKSSMMISDYSSVTWDMFYLNKPVVFYQFDQEDYLKSEGAYLDYENELFGDVVFNSEQAVNVLIKYVENGFLENPKYTAMRNKYIDFHDHKNSERIYKGILKKKKLLGIDNSWTIVRRISRKFWKIKKRLLHYNSKQS